MRHAKLTNADLPFLISGGMRVLTGALVLLGLWSGVFSDEAKAQTPLLQNVIYNGTSIVNEPIGDSPRFLVAIENRLPSGGVAGCTGVAIAKDVILTAGHCLVDAVTINVKIISQLSPLEYEVIRAKAWKQNPNFNGGYDGVLLRHLNDSTASKFQDLGLIVLEKESRLVQPITFAPPDYNPKGANSWMFVFGQGRDENYELNGRLEFANLIRTSQMQGSWIFKSYLKDEEGWCVRDSGGPVTIGADDEYSAGQKRHFLLGIAFSFFDGFRKGDPNEIVRIYGSEDRAPGCGGRVGYTLIGPYISWIRKTVRELLPDESRKLQIFGER